MGGFMSGFTGEVVGIAVGDRGAIRGFCCRMPEACVSGHFDALCTSQLEQRWVPHAGHDSTSNVIPVAEHRHFSFVSS